MKIIKIFIGVGMTISIILFFIWVSWKGILSFFLGVVLSSWLILSNNPLFMTMVDMIEDRYKNKEEDLIEETRK